MNTTAIINIARQQLGLDEDVYRALLVRVTGESSLRRMTVRQKIAVVDELKRKGFRVTAGNKKLPVAAKPYIRMIHALWKSCHRSGIIDNGSREALRVFCRNLLFPGNSSVAVDPDTLSFDQASPIIDALKAMEKRGRHA
ncbi:regulatory protein GemA [Rhizobium cremeum]|uniref:regulatory protein GemA n=1 Tax=Rhizobium cremeum TaxID=2813827 RepID=UPI001FD53A34|nr:regulatory protein GemA [Rhizobium cremeum]MCJ7996083.1 regulatory protein GemA [Rhizobium cremeum]MCJ8001342.1 regulatory protein GemA [Rhizobium cremeum]